MSKYRMPSAKELRDELRALRKEAVRPISKMKKGDVSAEIEKLRKAREDTPLPAATAGTSAKKTAELKPKLTAEYRREFEGLKAGNKPVTAAKAKGVKASDAKTAPEKKKSSKLERLMAMMEEMSSSGEE